MKKLFISISVLFFCTASFGQKKDSIPPPKKYVFVLDSLQFKYVDSLLQRAHYFVGRALPFEEADLLKQNFASIITFFLQEKKQQDLANPKNK
jgi:hypothetical protein